MHAGITRDADFLAECFCKCLADDDATVFGCVVEIDVQITLRLQGDVDQGMARQLLQHVIEETDAGGDVIRTIAIEIDRGLDAGLFGLAVDGGGACHGGDPCAAWSKASLYQLASAPASGRASIV